MDATITITINPREAVPEGTERVAWLERHGVPAESAQVTVTASLAEWQSAGATIRADGGIGGWAESAARGGLLSYGDEAELYTALVRAALAIVRETGHTPETLSADVVRDHAAARAMAEAKSAAERAARTEAERVARDARIAAIREQGLGAILRQREGRWESTYQPDSLDRIRDAKAALGDDCYERADVEATARNARADEARARTVRDLVTRHGSDNQRARLAEGLLPDSEVIELLADTALAGMGDAPRYERIRNAEIEHAEGCVEPDYSSWAGAPESLSAGDYERASVVRARLEACRPGIQDALPGADLVVEVRVHRVWCEGHDDCEQIERVGVRARVTLGPLTAMREYGI